MADFDISLLRTFTSVVDSGGFSRASERVHRTQSTVSQQIKKLEEQAGRQLLSRGARASLLTPDGERMLSYARRILALHDEARNLFAEDLPELVRVGVTEDLAVDSLPAVLSPLALGDDHVRLEVRCGLSRLLEADLANGLLDVALFRRVESQPITGPDCWAETLQWVCAQGSHPEQSQVLPLVLFPHECILRGYALGQLDAMGRRWRIAYTSPNVSGIQAAVRAGLGVALLSQRMLPLQGLRVIAPGEGLPSLPQVSVLLRSGTGALGPRAQQVMQLLRAHMDETVAASHKQASVSAAIPA